MKGNNCTYTTDTDVEMQLGVGTVQITGVDLTTPEVIDICNSLDQHGLRFVSLRDCKVADKDFKKLLKSVGLCKSILQLNLSLGIVRDRFRVELVAQALVRNRSLCVLSLHGNKLGNKGVSVLCQSLSQHPNITSLDLGDCEIGDDGLDAICDLLPPNGAKSGIKDLTLSANNDITARGWAKLSMAIGVSSMLKALYLDYNTLGDYGAGCIAVALAANRRIEVLDLEGTGLTEHTAKLFLHLVKSYPVRLRRLVLSENRVHRSTVEAIRTCLRDYAEDEDSASEYGESVIGQSEEATLVKLREVQTEHQSGISEALEGLGALMNTPEKRPQNVVKSSEDRQIKAAKTPIAYSTPNSSSKLPQKSKPKAERGSETDLTETEEWGEELNEVPL